ncbi:jg25654, partial [Pararge aegeria aegeria]
FAEKELDHWLTACTVGYIEKLYAVDEFEGAARSTKLTDKNVKPNSYDKIKRAQSDYIEKLYAVDEFEGAARSTKLTDKNVKPNSYDKIKKKDLITGLVPPFKTRDTKSHHGPCIPTNAPPVRLPVYSLYLEYPRSSWTKYCLGEGDSTGSIYIRFFDSEGLRDVPPKKTPEPVTTMETNTLTTDTTPSVDTVLEEIQAVLMEPKVF